MHFPILKIKIFKYHLNKYKQGIKNYLVLLVYCLVLTIGEFTDGGLH